MPRAPRAPECPSACRGHVCSLHGLKHRQQSLQHAHLQLRRRQWHSNPQQHQMRRTHHCAAAAAPGTVLSDATAGSGEERVPSVRIRSARPGDAEEVAQLCSQVFAHSMLSDAIPEAGTRAQQQELEGVEQLEARELAAPMLDSIRRAFRGKQQATVETRKWRLYRRYAALKAEIASLRGEPAQFVAPPSPQERRQVSRWDAMRSFAILLAHDGASGRLLGCATLSLTACEANLPPPLPTRKPLRMYLSNMVVRPEVRRRGVASSLLQASARLGRRWRQDSLWLHVEQANSSAIGLYQAAGAGASQQPEVTGGRTRKEDGVFIWDTRLQLSDRPERP